MIKAAELPCYLVPPQRLSIWNVRFFFVSFGASYLPLEVSAVTMSLRAAEVIKTCGSHARQIVSPAVDTRA